MLVMLGQSVWCSLFTIVYIRFTNDWSSFVTPAWDTFLHLPIYQSVSSTFHQGLLQHMYFLEHSFGVTCISRLTRQGSLSMPLTVHLMFLCQLSRADKTFIVLCFFNVTSCSALQKRCDKYHYYIIGKWTLHLVERTVFIRKITWQTMFSGVSAINIMSIWSTVW